jgi:hypothetical protein
LGPGASGASGAGRSAMTRVHPPDHWDKASRHRAGDKGYFPALRLP